MENYLKWARETFAGDLYAVETTGISIDEAALNYAKCSLSLEQRHKNAENAVMGGAIYTLIDLTFAIAANTFSMSTVTLNANIEYLAAAPCEGTLIAVAKCIKSGKNICRFDIDVYNDSNIHIAAARMSGYRR